MIRNCFFLIIVSMFTLTIIGCNRLEFESQWSEDPISVDGKDMDWETETLHQLESMPVSLGLRNDEEFLYILLLVDNAMMAENLRAAGISLWFTRENEKHPNLGFHYTGSDTVWSDPDPDDSFWEYLTTDQKTRFRRRRSELKNMIRVVHGDKSLQISLEGSKGVAAAPVLQQGFLGYEFMIPIQIGENRPYAIESQPGATIEIEIILGGIEREEMPQGYSEGGEMGGGRMGGRGGGMGMMPGRRSLFDREIRFIVILADNSKYL